MVISARNPVHSVLFLILGFFNAAGLFILLGAEFVALILVIVYVGAVAVLFLFVVMMLDINFAELRRGAMKHVTLGAIVGGLLMVELFMIYKNWPTKVVEVSAEAATTNTQQIGAVLYTDYIYAFQVAGIILLVAMVGAIVLTFRRRAGTRSQKVAQQTARTVDQSMEIRKIDSGTGV